MCHIRHSFFSSCLFLFQFLFVFFYLSRLKNRTNIPTWWDGVIMRLYVLDLGTAKVKQMTGMLGGKKADLSKCRGPAI